MNDTSTEHLQLLKKLLSFEFNYEPQSFDFGTVYNNIAWSYCCLKQYANGLSYAKKAVQKNPEHAYSWETLGELYFYLDKYQDCVDAMTKCIECDDTNNLGSAYQFRGNALLKLGKNKDGQNDLKKSKQL